MSLAGPSVRCPRQMNGGCEPGGGRFVVSYINRYLMSIDYPVIKDKYLTGKNSELAIHKRQLLTAETSVLTIKLSGRG
jgi:hypothetical protein